jgi:hypothetical protein
MRLIKVSIPSAFLNTLRPNASATPHQTNADVGNAAARTALPAPAQNKPERPEKLRAVLFHFFHFFLLSTA